MLAVFCIGRPLGAGSDRDIRWQTIDVPEATKGTALTGINPAGDVVGYFSDASGVHAFVHSHRGDYQTFDYVRPDGTTAATTMANGINAGGDVVGWYRMKGEPAMAFHGFLRSADGNIAPMDYPGHPHTVLQKINPDGTIVGCYHANDMSDSMHAIWHQNGIWTELTAARTMANAVVPGGVTTVGRSVGSGGFSHGWIMTNGTMTPFDVPGSLATNPLGINPAGDIVGFYKNAASAITDSCCTTAYSQPSISPTRLRPRHGTSIPAETSSATTPTATKSCTASSEVERKATTSNRNVWRG